MKLLLSGVSLLCILIGVGFQTAATNHTTDRAPHLPSLNPKHWKPVWMVKDWYTSKGYRYQWIGTLAIVAGGLCGILRWLILP